jgi:hypothetical protein
MGLDPAGGEELRFGITTVRDENFAPSRDSRTWLSALLFRPLADALPPVFEPFQIFLGVRHPVG